jgi:hypothetical protein
MKTFPTRLDFVTPPISVTRFDAGPAALRAHFVVLAASADAAVRGISKSRAARRPLQRRGEQVPPAPNHDAIESDVLKITASRPTLSSITSMSWHIPCLDLVSDEGGRSALIGCDDALSNQRCRGASIDPHRHVRVFRKMHAGPSQEPPGAARLSGSRFFPRRS